MSTKHTISDIFSGNNGGRRRMSPRAWLLIGVCALLGAFLVGCPESETAKKEAGGACTSANECVTGLTCNADSRCMGPRYGSGRSMYVDSDCTGVSTCMTSTSTCVDNRPLASLGGDSTFTITEAGTQTAAIPVNLNRAPGAGTTVTVMVGISPAPDASDYSVAGTGVTATGAVAAVSFDDTDITRMLQITAALDDDNVNEALTVTLQDGTGYRVGSSDTERTVNITDDDAPLLSVLFLESLLSTATRTAISEGGTVADRNLVISFSLSKAPLRNITIPYTIGGSNIDINDFVRATSRSPGGAECMDALTSTDLQPLIPWRLSLAQPAPQHLIMLIVLLLTAATQVTRH